MDFVQKTNWQDDPSTATPITAAELLRLEAGIVEGARNATEGQAGNVELASPAEMAAGTDLTRVPAVERVKTYVANQIATALSTIPGVSPASESASGVVELATTGEMTAGTDTPLRVPSVAKVAAYVTNAINTFSASVSASLSTKADKSGSINQFSDVSDAAVTDDSVLMWDANQYIPVNLNTFYASADPSTGKLLDTELPPFTLSGVIVNSGENPPPNTPIGAVILRRQAAASLIPTIVNEVFSQNSDTLVISSGAGFSIGDWFGIAIGASGEVPDVPVQYNITFASGAATAVTIPTALSSGTAQANMRLFKVTTGISANTNITIIARNNANTLNNTRVHLLGALFRLPNLASPNPLSDVVDQTVSGNGSTNSTMDKTVTTGGATSQASTLGLEVATINSNTAVDARVVSPTNGWQQLSLVTSTLPAGGKQMLVAYKVLTTVQNVTGNIHIEGSGTSTGSSGAWAMVVSALKAA